MKNYRLLAPIVMIALFALGIYMVASSNLKEEEEYNSYLQAARGYAEQELDVYAVENYQKAMELRPSVDIYLEVGQYYRQSDQLARATSWAESIVDSFPKDPKSYEFMIELCMENQTYGECYKYYDTVVAKGYMTDKIKEMMDRIKYSYYLSGNYDEVSIYSENYVAYRTKDKWGYLNSTLGKAINTLYAFAGPFYQSMAPVVEHDGEAYYIDTSGNKVYIVRDEEYVEKLGLMENNIYSVYNGKVWNFYEKDKGLLYGGFTDASVIGGGVFAAQKDGVWNLYNSSGEKLTEEGFEDVVRDEKNVAYRNERFIVKKNGAYIMVDSAGQQHGTESYEDARLFNETNGYAAVKKDGLWGFVDKNGEWFINSTYEDARSYMNGYAGVMQDGKWGFINMNNEVCIACEFSAVKDFNARGISFIFDEGSWRGLVLHKDNH